jgi:hypothetical protein
MYYIAQFTTNNRHISGQDNVAADDLSRRICHCATIPRRTGRSAKQRRRTSDTRHHRLHLLRHVCRKTSAVHSSSNTTTSVSVRQRPVATRHQSNSEAGRTVFRVARHTEILSHLGTGLPSLSTLQSLPPHCYSFGRLHNNTSPFSSLPHRP